MFFKSLSADIRGAMILGVTLVITLGVGSVAGLIWSIGFAGTPWGVFRAAVAAASGAVLMWLLSAIIVVARR